MPPMPSEQIYHDFSENEKPKILAEVQKDIVENFQKSYPEAYRRIEEVNFDLISEIYTNEVKNEIPLSFLSKKMDYYSKNPNKLTMQETFKHDIKAIIKLQLENPQLSMKDAVKKYSETAIGIEQHIHETGKNIQETGESLSVEVEKIISNLLKDSDWKDDVEARIWMNNFFTSETDTNDTNYEVNAIKERIMFENKNLGKNISTKEVVQKYFEGAQQEKEELLANIDTFKKAPKYSNTSEFITEFIDKNIFLSPEGKKLLQEKVSENGPWSVENHVKQVMEKDDRIVVISGEIQPDYSISESYYYFEQEPDDFIKNYVDNNDALSKRAKDFIKDLVKKEQGPWTYKGKVDISEQGRKITFKKRNAESYYYLDN